MAYKMVDELEKLCGRVAGAAIEHRALITQALAERFKHKLEEGQTIPDIFQVQTWLAEELHETHAEVTASESDLKAELTLDRQDRELRAQLVSAVRQHLFSARSIFDALYGAGGAGVMFQEPPGFRVRIDPVPLYRQGMTVHDNILNPRFRRPPVRFDLDVDLEKLARGMEPGLEGLQRTLVVLRTGTQASNASLEAKETHMSVLERRTGLAARLLEALCAWAGHEGIARRVRLSSHTGGAQAQRRRPNTAGAPGDETPGDETPADETSADSAAVVATPASSGRARPDIPSGDASPGDASPSDASPGDASQGDASQGDASPGDAATSLTSEG